MSLNLIQLIILITIVTQKMRDTFYLSKTNAFMKKLM